ncbi:MAG TPA: nuclear transport factor 2 family protein [Phnomibacter sp.]|nr:nuclear transport factor 2 family protein [Phnomibacter sp.]
MRHFLCLTILSVALSGLAAQPISAGEKNVQQTIEKLFAALSDGDTAAMKTLVTTDVRFYEYGQIWTLDTLTRKVMQAKSIPGFKRSNRFEFVRTRMQHETAWATYYLTSVFTRNGKEETVKWMETVVLVKEKKSWKVDVLHSTNLTQK